jgi:N-acetylglucosamine-6-phosphate deacetylase
MPTRPAASPWTLQAGAILCDDGLQGPGFVTIAGDQVVAVSDGRHPRPDLDCDGDTLVPGFVDLQINGAAGCDFLSPTEAGLAAAESYLLSTGTVAYLPTLITSPEAQLRDALAFFSSRMCQASTPRIIGVHLEGPFLSPVRPGAHPPEYLRSPSTEWIGRLLDDVRGVVRLVTLAPELEGALDVIEALVARGIIVSLGHTDATYEQAMAGFARGARVATHLFNAMRPLHHREPGAVGAALAHPDVVCSVIADHVHLHPAVLRYIIALKGPDRVALITDAIAAAGAAGTTHRLGERVVNVECGAPRLVDGTLAGSVLAMDRAVRNVVGIGVARGDALRMAGRTPARVLGLDGAIAPGARADVVAIDPQGRVSATVVGGRIAYSA